MQNQQDHETFRYTYSAKEQREIEKIREKYLPQDMDKMERLRRLDRGVTRKGMTVALIVGILGSLILGIGMCCTMLWAETYFLLGIVVGIVGVVLVAIAYPIYTFITKRERRRVAPEIIRLTDELMK